MAPNIKNLRSEFDRLALELSLIEDILAQPPYADGPLEDCLRQWLILLADFLAADFAQGWHYEALQGKQSGRLVCSNTLVVRSENAPALRAASIELDTSEVRGLPARALKANQLVYIEQLKKSQKLLRFNAMATDGINSVVLLPIQTSLSSTYVFELYFRRVDPLDAPAVDLLQKLLRVFKNFVSVARRTSGESLYTETEYSILLDAVPAMVWYKDRHNRILAINSYAAETTGMTVAEIVGKKTEEVYPKDAAKYYLDDLEVIRSGKPKRKIIEEIRGQNDERIWVSTDKVPYVKSGQVEGIIVFATDVSELKQAEEELLKIKNELESKVEERTQELAVVNIFFTLSRELLCIADTRGYFTRLNPVWTERLGYSLEELYSRPYIDFVHEDDRARTALVGAQLAAGSAVRDFENRYRAKDGSYRYFRWSASTFGDSVFAVAYDITDRKIVEQALIDMNERFTSIGKHMPGVIYQFVMTADGRFSFPYLSEGCRDLLGYEAHEIQADGSLAFSVMHPDDSEAMMRLSLESAKNMTVFSCEGRVMEPDGTIRRYIRATSTPERLENGYVLFNGLVMDVTDLKLAQEEVRKLNLDLEERVDSLRKANEDLEYLTKELEKAYDKALEASKLKSEFVANISHEIRTPLSAVIGTTDLLLDTALDAQQREYAGTARDSAKSLLTIINDILDFSKIEAGKIELETIDFELQNIVEGSVDLFLKDSAAKKLTLLTYVDPILPGIVTGDPVRIRQVLINLVSNAVKFTHEGEIVVRVIPFECSDPPDTKYGGPQFVRFEVRDSGIGMPENVRQRLFTPFVQADGSTTRKFGGTGLGLSICRRLADLMDGEIGFESTEGEGTLFWFTVPLPAAQSIARLRKQAPARKKEDIVFLCGGSESTQMVLTTYIESEGYLIESATGIGGTLYRLDAVVADGKNIFAIVVDGGQQPYEAINIIDAIRRDARYKNTKIVFLTDLHHREAGSIACERGADLCVFKPFRRTDLLSAVFFRQRETGSSAVAGQERASKRKVTETIRVLVVEDNTLMRGLTVKQLEKFGIECDFATNGAEAVDKTFMNDYSLVLMDCQMPVMDGFEATLEIRKREFVKGGHVPIIAMTAYAMAGDREQCIASGMDDYLSKPVTIDQLETMLEKWLSDIFSPKLQLSHSGSALTDGGSTKPKAKGTDVSTLADDEVVRTADSTGDEPLLDIQTVVDHYGQNSLHEILSSFIDELEELVPSIVSEVKNGDSEMVGRLAHQLKGLVAVLSAKQMSEIALKLEQACRDGRTHEIAYHTRELVRAKTELVNFINKFLVSN